MHLSPMVFARMSGPAMTEIVPDPFHAQVLILQVISLLDARVLYQCVDGSKRPLHVLENNTGSYKT